MYSRLVDRYTVKMWAGCGACLGPRPEEACAKGTKGALMEKLIAPPGGTGAHTGIGSMKQGRRPASPFQFVHVFAANSAAGIRQAQRAADELQDLEATAPRALVHALEGDLNWITAGGRTVPFLWHPPWGTDILPDREAVRREVEAGRALLLEDALSLLRPGEQLLLDIKQGTHPSDAAMHVVREMLEAANLLERVAIVSYSSDTLLCWSQALPRATRVLHTLLMRGPRGVELSIRPTLPKTLRSMTFDDILTLPHVEVVMLSFGSALTRRAVQRLRRRCVSRGKQYWAGKLLSKRAVRRAYLGADGGYIWNSRAATKVLRRIAADPAKHFIADFALTCPTGGPGRALGD